MTTYQRRARWIRRMQDRAARRREREIFRQAATALPRWPIRPEYSSSRRAA